MNNSIKQVCIEDSNVETSILKAEPTFEFDKELESAMDQYNGLLKELVDK
ncbi:hypothetical protein [Streptococcus suis]